MKVLIIDLGSKFNLFGGQAKMAAVLNKKLNKYFDTYYLGYETIYSNGINKPVFIDRGKHLGASVRKSRISEFWGARLGYNLLVVNSLRDLNKTDLLQRVRAIKPDIIITNSIQDINLVRFFKKSGLHFKSIYIDHGSLSTSITSYFSREGMPLTIGTGLDSISLEQKKKKFFEFYDMSIALNKEHLSQISKFTKKVKLIFNGVDVKTTKNLALEQKLRDSYNIKKDDFVVLYVGRMFERQKNVSALIRAFVRLKNNNMKLILVGDGPSMNEYKQLANKDKRIIFAGKKDEKEINYIYNISHLFALPSFWEGFPITVLEAAAHSLPIIVSDNIAENFEDKQLGEIISFDPTNDAQIREHITKLYNDYGLRRKAIITSVKISKLFTEKRMIEEYRRLLQKL